MTRASVLVPTHNRPGTLALSVDSALAQTVDDLEVIIIGDGVTDALRAEALRLAAGDERVVFLDLPKGEHHGEVHRDTAIRSARSDAIFYLCDDDLFLPGHVSDLLQLLEGGATFAQSLNGWLDADGTVHRYPGSLSDPASVAGVLEPAGAYNFISLTGTAHSRPFYLDGQGWSTTPVHDFPDRYQWRKMIGRPGFSGATSSRMTALQFPVTEPSRAGITGASQIAELARWREFIREPDAQERIDRLADAASNVEYAHYMRSLIAAHARIDALTAEFGRAGIDLAELEELRRWRDEVQSTVSWRITRPLRAVRRRF